MLQKIAGFTILMLLWMTSLSAAADNRIGVVDFNRILERSAAGKAIQKKIQEKGGELKSELERAQNDIKSLQESYRQEAPLWSKEQRAEKEGIFKKKLNDFNLLKMKNEKEFKEFNARLISDLRSEIVTLAREKAEKEGYLLIIEKQSGSVIYTHESMNITDAFVKDMDKKPAAK